MSVWKLLSWRGSSSTKGSTQVSMNFVVCWSTQWWADLALGPNKTCGLFGTKEGNKMGNMHCKHSESALNGDMKFMEWYSPGNTVFCNKWKPKYDFTGKLEVKSRENFVEKIKISVPIKEGKRKVIKEKRLTAANKLVRTGTKKGCRKATKESKAHFL